MKKCEKEGFTRAGTTDLSSRNTLTSDLAKVIGDHKGMDPLNPDFSLYNYLDTEALDDFVESVSVGLELRLPIEDVEVCLCKSDSSTVEIYVSDR